MTYNDYASKYINGNSIGEDLFLKSKENLKSGGCLTIFQLLLYNKVFYYRCHYSYDWAGRFAYCSHVKAGSWNNTFSVTEPIVFDVVKDKNVFPVIQFLELFDWFSDCSAPRQLIHYTEPIWLAD